MFKTKKRFNGKFAFATDIGKIRINNEDQALALTNTNGDVLLVVCDGMGGQNKGDLASSLAIHVVRDEFKEVNKFHNLLHIRWWLNETLKLANQTVYSDANRNPSYKGMGTTLSLVVIYKKYIIIANVGDSRVYRYSSNGFEQLTEDQTYVGYLYRTGQIKKEEMKTHPKRSILMNALGIYPTLNVDFTIKKYYGETLLVCSDGLYNNADDNAVVSILNNNDAVEQKVNELISVANNNGGSDNIAIALWESYNAD